MSLPTGSARFEVQMSEHEQRVRAAREEAVAALRADGLERTAAKLVAEGSEAAIRSLFWWDAPEAVLSRRALCRLYLAETEPCFRPVGVVLACDALPVGDHPLHGGDGFRAVRSFTGDDCAHFFPVPPARAANLVRGPQSEGLETLDGRRFGLVFLAAVRALYPRVTWAVRALAGEPVWAAFGYDGQRLVAIVCEVRG